MKTITVGIVGDFNREFLPHQATNDALKHVEQSLSVHIDIQWLATSFLEENVDKKLQHFDALWCAPGSPYQSMNGALNAIQFARRSKIPFLGTCGGFQHVVIEYARNVLRFQDAEHAEYDPYSSRLFISALSCSLVGKTMKINLKPGSRVHQIYQAHQAEEQYYCNFGLNPEYQKLIGSQTLQIVGVDENEEARILELPEHPFFIATLFVPQLTSCPEQPHRLITAYIETTINEVSRKKVFLPQHGQPSATRLV